MEITRVPSKIIIPVPILINVILSLSPVFGSASRVDEEISDI